MTGSIFSQAWAITGELEGEVRQAIHQGLFKTNPLGVSAQLPGFEGQQLSADKMAIAWADYLSMGAEQNVPVLPIQGIMSRGYTWTNYFSNEFLIRMLNAIREDKTKAGAILNVNSGGGTVDSTDELADAVAALRAEKPVIAQVNFGGSAAYWVSSQATEVQVSAGPVARIGSIGTLYIHTNRARALEQAGLDTKILRSQGSVDKARINDIEPLTPELEEQLVRELTASNKVFKSYVRKGRGGKISSDEVYTGKMYDAATSIKLGLADRSGTLASAYQRVIQLSK